MLNRGTLLPTYCFVISKETVFILSAADYGLGQQKMS